MESEGAFSIASAVPWKLNSTAHFLHSFCCRLKPASHMSERILCLQDSDGAAHPYRRRWQAEALKILASSPKAERWSDFCGCREPSQQRRAPCGDPGGGEIPMRSNAWPESAFPLVEGLAWFKYRLKTIDTKNYRRSFTFWDKWPPFYLWRQRKWNK